MKKSLQFLLLCLGTTICLAETPSDTATPPPSVKTEQSFLNMKPETICSCGLDKLTQDEKAALQTWIQKYSSECTACKCNACQSEVIAPVKVQSIKEGAKSVELADGRIFLLSSAARKIAVLWNVGDLIRVETTKKKKYSNLTHIPTGKVVKAKLFTNEIEESSK